MCEFLDLPNVMPGVGCCRCKGYNGLQRVECKFCREKICPVHVPPDIKRCPECGFGMRMAADLTTENCPSCRHDRSLKEAAAAAS